MKYRICSHILPILFQEINFQWGIGWLQVVVYMWSLTGPCVSIKLSLGDHLYPRGSWHVIRQVWLAVVNVARAHDQRMKHHFTLDRSAVGFLEAKGFVECLQQFECSWLFNFAILLLHHRCIMEYCFICVQCWNQYSHRSTYFAVSVQSWYTSAYMENKDRSIKNFVNNKLLCVSNV